MTWLAILAAGVGAGLGAQLRLAAEQIQAAARSRHAPRDATWLAVGG